MANPFVQTLVFAAAVANGVCLAQTPAAAGAMLINGGLATGGVATFDVARRVVFVSAGADSARVFTITGTDRYGNTISEAVTGVTATGVVTQLDYKTVTGITVDAATAGAITVGTSDGTFGAVGSGPWLPCHFYITPVQIEHFVTVAAASPATYTVEYTPDDPNVMAPPGGIASSLATAIPGTPPQPGSGTIEPRSFSPPQAWPDQTLVNKNVSARVVYNGVPFAWRLTINSGTTAATLQSIQAGIIN